MEQLLSAAAQFGHIIGAALLIGGGGLVGYGLWPAFVGADEAALERRDAVLNCARKAIAAGIVLSLLTGLYKWLGPGGVGPLGNKGAYTGLLHAKIVLALVAFHFALSSSKAGDDRGGRARMAMWIGALIVLLAVMHRSRVFD